jgi:hypothetical protein
MKERVTSRGLRMAKMGLWAAVDRWWGAWVALLVRLAKREVWG